VRKKDDFFLSLSPVMGRRGSIKKKERKKEKMRE
jgi:hypothetical protein